MSRINCSRALRPFGLLAILICVCLVALGSTISWAHDHKPPRSVLHSGTTKQKGKPAGFCWSNEEHSLFCADPVPTYPKPVSLRRERVFVRLHKQQRPHERGVWLWAKNRKGRPKGEHKDLPSTLVKHRKRNGRVAWDVHFVLSKRCRYLYVLVWGAWDDEEGNNVEQDAGWRFLLKRRNYSARCRRAR